MDGVDLSSAKETVELSIFLQTSCSCSKQLQTTKDTNYGRTGSVRNGVGRPLEVRLLAKSRLDILLALGWGYIIGLQINQTSVP